MTVRELQRAIAKDRLTDRNRSGKPMFLHNMELRKELTRQLFRRMERDNLSKKELAEYLGITTPTIYTLFPVDCESNEYQLKGLNNKYVDLVLEYIASGTVRDRQMIDDYIENSTLMERQELMELIRERNERDNPTPKKETRSFDYDGIDK